MEGNGGELNLQRIAAALDAVGAKLECPVCDQTKWSRDPHPVAVPTHTDAGIAIGHGIPAFAITCKNCGFIRIHGIETLLGSAGHPEDDPD